MPPGRSGHNFSSSLTEIKDILFLGDHDIQVLRSKITDWIVTNPDTAPNGLRAHAQSQAVLPLMRQLYKDWREATKGSPVKPRRCQDAIMSLICYVLKTRRAQGKKEQSSLLRNDANAIDARAGEARPKALQSRLDELFDDSESAQDLAVAVSGDSRPVARTNPLGQNCKSLTQVLSTPKQRRDAPIQGRGAPSHGQGAPAQTQGAPAQSQGEPTQGQGMPAQGRNTLGQRQSRLAVNRRVSARNQGSSARAETAESPSLLTFKIVCHRTPTSGPHRALIAEYRDFVNDIGDGESIPCLSMGLFYHSLEQQLDFTRNDRIRYYDAQAAADKDVCRAGDFEDAVRGAYYHGSDNIVFEIHPLQPS